MTYPLVVTTGDAGPAGSVAGGYAATALNLAAAQLLYAEARTFAVKAPARLAGLRAAFHEATLRLPAAESVADVRAALGRILVALDDAHARVISPELDAGTLPFEVRRYDASVVVTAVHPSFAHALPVGAIVTAIDGQPIVELLAGVAARVSAATPGWRAIATARFALYGPIGSMAKVTYSVTGGPAQTALLPRVEKGAGLDEILAPRPLQNAEVSPGVRYLRVGALRRADLATVVPALQHARSIVLDLRGSGSDGALGLLAHLLEAPVASPRWGVPVVRPEGVVEYEESSWTLHPLAPPLRARIVALTDGRCVSSVETLVSLLRATGRVTVVGEPSAGTNGNIAELALPLGLHAQYTGLRVLLADGSDYNERAPSVDVLVTPTLADVQAGRDVILERGIRVAAGGVP
ncbi:MAG: hypothetical protein IPL61_29480 [Myxococcales bacterium]|nr:hypothetical protein [Myxococcales bacterium]